MRIFLAIFTVLIGCGDQSKSNMRSVGYSDYKNIEECWISEDGIFSSYVVFRETENYLIPYYFSNKCKLDDADSPYPLSVIDSLTAIKFSEDTGHYNRFVVIDKPVASNAGTELVIPDLSEQVYEVRGRVVQTQFDGRLYYKFASIESLVATQQSLEKIWKLQGLR